MGKAMMFPLASCLGLLAAVILSPVHCKVPHGAIRAEQRRNERSAESVRIQLDPKGGFLAGENTPVWLAYRENPGNATYMYTKLEKGIVKKAIEYWKSDAFEGIHKRARSVSNIMNYLHENPDDSIDPEIIDESDSPVPHAARRLKRQDWPIVYHPSVLAVMEYEGDWPIDQESQRILIFERIIYALAFWNGVDLHLRPIEDPRVRLRLAGIVIARNKEATRHSLRYRDPVIFDYKTSLEHVLEYWGVQARRANKDFRRGAYNVVGLMTDSIPAEDHEDGKARNIFFMSTLATAYTDGPPCNYEVDEPIGGLVVNDNLGFEGLQRAVHAMARILGHGAYGKIVCQTKPDGNGRTWDKCDLDVIRERLNSNGWCLALPKEYHQPGRPVETILPGKVMPASKQCKALGWKDGKVCSDKRTCDFLKCSNDHWYSKCYKAGVPLDGTTCDPGMICLHGECVINSTLIYRV